MQITAAPIRAWGKQRVMHGERKLVESGAQRAELVPLVFTGFQI